MRKLLISLSVLAGVVASASAVRAAPAVALPVFTGTAHVQPVWYDGHEWRHHEEWEWRRHEEERLRREEEARRWHHWHHGWGW